MFSILLIVAGFQIGHPFLAIFIVIMLWACILCSNPLRTKRRKKEYTNPIDEHGNENYGTINWLHDNKL